MHYAGYVRHSPFLCKADFAIIYDKKKTEHLPIMLYLYVPVKHPILQLLLFAAITSFTFLEGISSKLSSMAL